MPKYTAAVKGLTIVFQVLYRKVRYGLRIFDKLPVLASISLMKISCQKA